MLLAQSCWLFYIFVCFFLWFFCVFQKNIVYHFVECTQNEERRVKLKFEELKRKKNIYKKMIISKHLNCDLIVNRMG